jgi:hypothetical protein
MAGSDPKEYLSLIASENENYSEVYDKRFDIRILLLSTVKHDMALVQKQLLTLVQSLVIHIAGHGF